MNATTSRLRWRASSRYVIVAAATIAAMAAVVATPAAASAPNATTANDIRSAILNATGNDAWIIFTYHGVLTDGTGLPGDSGDVTAASFAAHMDAIRESGITVRTVAAALASLGT